MKKNFAIAKFTSVISKFTSLETLVLKSIYNAPAFFKYLDQN